jgi:hypothetical protein
MSCTWLYNTFCQNNLTYCGVTVRISTVRVCLDVGILARNWIGLKIPNPWCKGNGFHFQFFCLDAHEICCWNQMVAPNSKSCLDVWTKIARKITGKRREEVVVSTTGRSPAWGGPVRGRRFHLGRGSLLAAIPIRPPAWSRVGVRGGREEEEDGWEWGKVEEGAKELACAAAAGAPSWRDPRRSRRSQLARFVFSHKGVRGISFHGIPRRRARNRGPAGSYRREAHSEFPFFSKQQFYVLPNGRIQAPNSRFSDSKPKFLHPNAALGFCRSSKNNMVIMYNHNIYHKS